MSTVTFTVMDGDARGGRTGDDRAPRKSLSVSFVVISVWIDVDFIFAGLQLTGIHSQYFYEIFLAGYDEIFSINLWQ